MFSCNQFLLLILHSHLIDFHIYSSMGDSLLSKDVTLKVVLTPGQANFVIQKALEEL